MELLKPKPFFDKKSAHNLKNFQYRGVDEGYLYLLFFSPLADFLVSITPEWVAPNVLTLMGAISAHLPLVVMYWQFGVSAEGSVPGWFCLLQGVCFFVYRIFDEMDGKQARRT
jgi:ethanolaminephosphotransferase